MGRLTVIRAGAGTGKTHTISHTVADQVRNGLDPARILVTTYTRKAAAEIKGRILEQLLAADGSPKEERIGRAERLDLALIGTVHSVGHQLLSRYAFEMGLVPDLQVLEEGASARCLRDVLGVLPVDADRRELLTLATKLSIVDLNDIELRLLEKKRSNRIDAKAFTQQLERSVQRLVVLMANAQPKPPPDPAAYQELVKSVLRGMGELSDTTNKTKAAREKLELLDGRIGGPWQVYPSAAKLGAGKRSGADDLLQPVREAASRTAGSLELRNDLARFVTLIGRHTLALDEQYQRAKTERGLVDFTDLETLFLELLENESLSQRLAEEFEFVSVDEFQDTNPLQLAIFARLRHLSGSNDNLWVGDAKQSIYGFRGTDMSMVRNVWDNAAADEQKVLPKNYRSQAGLVELVGEVFAPVLGDEAKLEADRDALSKGIERWILEAKNNDMEAAALACGIAQLRQEGTAARDVAVLVRSHEQGRKVGRALAELGIPCLQELQGLLQTREGAVLLAGLRYVADHRDTLAAATISHLLSDQSHDVPHWLEQRLTDMAEAATEIGSAASHGWAGTDVEALRQLDARNASPSSIVQQTMECLGLSDRVPAWGNPGQRSANLDALIKISYVYEEGASELSGAATLVGLIGHLEDLATNQQDFIQPAAGLDAVNILTYHGSKGLEWPVVILCGLDFNRDPDMWSPEVTGGGNPHAPLEGRTMHYWPWPFGRSIPYGRLNSGAGLNELALASAEGMEAAQRRSEEDIRLLYVGFTRARDKLILAHRSRKCSKLEQLPRVEELLPSDAGPGKHAIDGVNTDYVVRMLNPTALLSEKADMDSAGQSWLPPATARENGERLARWLRPSAVEETSDGTVTGPVEWLPGRPFFPDGLRSDKQADLGNAVHTFLAALPSLTKANQEQCERTALNCIDAYKVGDLLAPRLVAQFGQGLCDWIASAYPGAAWHTEVPVSAPASDGQYWSGIIDLLLMLDDGHAVVIDHKCGPVRRRDVPDRAGRYGNQLRAYREILTAQGITVKETWIHLPLGRAMVQVEE